MVNLPLKSAIIEVCETQLEGSRLLKMSPSRLSLIVRGHVEPKPEELESFKRVLGPKKALRVLNPPEAA